MITVKDVLKMLERDKISFKNDRSISRNDYEWAEANGVIDYIQQLIEDIKVQDVPLNDALSDTEMKHENDKLLQVHLDTFPLLLRPLIECKGTGRPITGSDAYKVLDKWDKARKRNIK
ncbi:hypothetical protein KAU11_00330 [Candidatus Babeliales bacterium]|nr:hypothetical protein [Candidatus Babeliales bacterium]